MGQTQLEHPRLEVVLYFLLNVSSAFMLSAAHNVLFFVLDLKTIVFHFLHYLSTFVFLFLLYSKTASTKIPGALLKGCLLPPLVSQVSVSLLTACVHAGNRTGSLYLLRLFDCVTTLTVLRLAPKFLGPHSRNSTTSLLMVPLAVSASLSWLEFGHIEYDTLGLWLAPVLAVARGVNILILKRALKRFVAGSPAASFELFSLYHTGTVAVCLALPAFVSYLQSYVSHDASWESIDYVLMSMSVGFMICFKFSELWLVNHTDLAVYCAFEHTKFFAASIGQWWLQNMAHASIYAFIGKMVFVASSLRFWQNAEISQKRQIN